ncbi:MAG: tRNA ((37)-N6)-threonylcarbamoyltransferase complex ATPase subunit type 1 TsaE [Fibrobacterota bacterium]|jgi:tRNA threonylcarbamoyladenosine biosynthesis protein TsaE
MIRELFLPDEEATRRLGQDLSKDLMAGGLVFLHGDLGAGKTTLVRGLLEGLGWDGPVRSPSYALVHSYPILPKVNHLDLYRVKSLEEALDLDLDRLFAPSSVNLVEWPAVLGDAFTPALQVWLEPQGEGRKARIATPGA